MLVLQGLADGCDASEKLAERREQLPFHCANCPLGAALEAVPAPALLQLRTGSFNTRYYSRASTIRVIGRLLSHPGQLFCTM